MATIKSYTSVEQSRKLAEILPLETTDMCYVATHLDENDNLCYSTTPIILQERVAKFKTGVPCWSLAALLNLLPNEIITDNRFECHYQIDIRKHDGGDDTTLYQIAYGNNRGLSGSWHDMINTGEKENLIDACYEMIIRLHESNLL